MGPNLAKRLFYLPVTWSQIAFPNTCFLGGNVFRSVLWTSLKGYATNKFTNSYSRACLYIILSALLRQVADPVYICSFSLPLSSPWREVYATSGTFTLGPLRILARGLPYSFHSVLRQSRPVARSASMGLESWEREHVRVQDLYLTCALEESRGQDIHLDLKHVCITFNEFLSSQLEETLIKQIPHPHTDLKTRICQVKAQKRNLHYNQVQCAYYRTCGNSEAKNSWPLLLCTSLRKSQPCSRLLFSGPIRMVSKALFWSSS